MKACLLGALTFGTACSLLSLDGFTTDSTEATAGADTSAASTTTSTAATTTSAGSGGGGGSTNTAASGDGGASTSMASTVGAGGVMTAGSAGDGGSGGSEPRPCGDRIVGPGEECDDGNDVAGDGCNDCVVECDGAKDPTTLHCYSLSTTAANWDTARADCIAWGGDLVGLSSAEEHDFVNLLFTSPGPYWTGGNDRAVEGVYVWSNGEPWGYEPWEPGEPNDQPGVSGQNCLDLYDNPSAGPVLGDNPCAMTGPDNNGYVCERYPP